MITHQSNTQCDCGSWYRNGQKCNVCDRIIIEQPEPEEKFINRTLFRARQWSKKLHRYLTINEIKNGKTGG